MIGLGDEPRSCDQVRRKNDVFTLSVANSAWLLMYFHLIDQVY